MTLKSNINYYLNITASPAPPVQYYFINTVPQQSTIQHHFTIITTPSPPPLHINFTVTSIQPIADAKKI